VGWLEGRVAIVTGGARGLGRAHALLLAAEGAQVVVNDISGAEDVVREIEASGGQAVAAAGDVADWDDGRRLVSAAVDAFGDLHVLVNNAAILRDRYIVNMSEEEWDSVIATDLKGHFVLLRHAAEHWRRRWEDGARLRPSVVNTSSTSGLVGNPGQANYGAAKAGVAALTSIAAQELARFGVRVNAISPAARTRLTEATPGLGDMVAAPSDPSRFDEWDPANASPLVAWLASAGCSVTGRVFQVFGGSITCMSGWSRAGGIERSERWTIEGIAEELPRIL
jgi:NAD(P)-dependent dehydrogenase (short-subunit alcohol dehydrogenase family)